MSRMSRYPNGFSAGALIRNMPLGDGVSGKVFWVGNNSVKLEGEKTAGNVNLNGSGGTFLAPFASLDYAIGQCAAERGDVIMVRPGYTDTISVAAGIALDVAGVSIIGLGRGAKRPVINLTATASTFTMSAADCSISNILFTGGVDAIVSMIVVSAADCSIENCELRDVTGQMTLGILTTAAADRLKILGHVHRGDSAAGTGAGIAIVGGSGIEIQIDVMDGNFSVAGIDVRTTASTDLYVHDVGRFYTRNAADIFLIDTITGSTGQIGPFINLRLKDHAANITEACTGATFVYMQPINIVNLAGESSIQLNITASTDA